MGKQMKIIKCVVKHSQSQIHLTIWGTFCCRRSLAPPSSPCFRCLRLPPSPPSGRLNVLANVVRKPMRQIFSEFSGKPAKAGEDEYTGSGDVKYHLGTSYNRPTTNGKMVALSLMANPR